jgi:hypothetical protein
MSIDKSTARPWRQYRPVHLTGSGWSCLLHNEPIPAARALGATRAHAVANAALISRAVMMNDRLNRILSSPPQDHEEARRLVWLREKLRE